jgi:hypothetical protein
MEENIQEILRRDDSKEKAHLYGMRKSCLKDIINPEKNKKGKFRSTSLYHFREILTRKEN